jgi:hypothetical protein
MNWFFQKKGKLKGTFSYPSRGLKGNKAGDWEFKSPIIIMVLLGLIIWSNKGCVVHHGLAIHIKKNLKAKEELWTFKYFTMQKF